MEFTFGLVSGVAGTLVVTLIITITAAIIINSKKGK